MKMAALVVVLGIVGLCADAEPAAKMWTESHNTAYQAAETGGFQAGYTSALMDTATLTEDQRNAVGWLMLRVSTIDLMHAVDAFYGDPANADVPIPSAEKFCFEALISKLDGGVALLNAIYANVGGWKPYTSWADYKRQHGIQ